MSGHLGGSTNSETGPVAAEGYPSPAGTAADTPEAVAVGALIAAAREPRGPDGQPLAGVGGLKTLEAAMHSAMGGREAAELLKEAHAKMQAAWTASLFLKQRDAVVLVRPDTAFALGEAAGAMAKAKALLGRDLDDRVRLAVLAEDGAKAEG